MAQQNQIRHPKTVAKVTATASNCKVKVSLKKRKEDAKQALYLNRI